MPSIFSRIHPTLHTPLHSQIWCGIVAAVLAGIFNVHSLSHILSVGTLVRQGLNFKYPFAFLIDTYTFQFHIIFGVPLFQTGYSVVAACVVALRLNDKKERESANRWTSSWQEGVICLVIIACSGFGAGIFYRFSASVIFILLSFGVAVVASAVLHYRQVSSLKHKPTLFLIS